MLSYSMDQNRPRTPFDVGLGELLARTRCRAVRGAEFEAVCRLRYEAYRREGTLPDNAPVPFCDRYDELPNATTFAFYIDERLVSSIRIHVGNRDNPEIPALQVFADHLDPLIAAGETLIDPTRFVIDFDSSRLYPKIPYLVLRVAHLAGIWSDADRLLATVRKEHEAFYRRFSGHRLLCPARPYPSLKKPVSLMMLDHRAERARLAARHPYFASSYDEKAALFGGIAPAGALLYPPLVA